MGLESIDLLPAIADVTKRWIERGQLISGTDAREKEFYNAGVIYKQFLLPTV